MTMCLDCQESASGVCTMHNGTVLLDREAYARSDVYPPEVEAIGDMRGCTDEGHAFGCPCGVGGDPILEEEKEDE